MVKEIFKKDNIKKIVSGILLFGFIITGFLDALLQGKKTFSSIMGMDITRVYIYTFVLLIIGCWLLYHKWFVGIGFIALAAFSSYFPQYRFLHNYFASILIYIGIVTDIVIRREIKWLIPLIVVGIIQGISFQSVAFKNSWLYSHYFVGCMEFLALCTGSVFIVKNI